MGRVCAPPMDPGELNDDVDLLAAHDAGTHAVDASPGLGGWNAIHVF